jgi:hypothetical protein
LFEIDNIKHLAYITDRKSPRLKRDKKELLRATRSKEWQELVVNMSSKKAQKYAIS